MENTTNFIPYIVMAINVVVLVGVFSYGIYCVSSGSCSTPNGKSK